MDWSYDSWPTGEPYDWGGAGRGHTIYDATDYHVDLGCGKLKKGRIGIDHYRAPGVNIVMDLDTLRVFGIAEEVGATADHQSYHQDGFQEGGLPFADGEIESVISHHCLEHISAGFIPLVDEVYRILKPGGIFYAITPLFPSRAAVEDPDHKRYFTCNEKTCTWDAFCGHLGDENNPTGSWLDSFSVPYTSARFEMLHRDYTAPLAPEQQWGPEDVRELRVALRAVK